MKKRFSDGSTVSASGTRTAPQRPARRAARIADAADGLSAEEEAALAEWGAAGTGFNIGDSLNKSLGNLSPADQATLNKNILGAYKPVQLEEIRKNDANNATNDRFGNDMAWLDPEFEQETALLGDSARSKVFADPELVADQNRALDSLFGIARDGGATAQERARRAGARNDSENWLRGQREADMQNLAERGLSGSGAEILALGNDRQAAAQRNSAADLETDAWLEQRALDATMKGGQLAGEMRDTGFDEGQTRGQAQDEFYALNQKTLNDANSAYADFKRQAWGDTVDRRTAWDMNKLNKGLDVAGGLLDSDVGQNQAGYSSGTRTAGADVGSGNNSIDALNGYLGAGNPAAQQAQRDQDAAWGAIPGKTGSFLDQAVNTATGGFGGGGGGALKTGGGSTWGSSGAGSGSVGQFGSAPTVSDVTGEDDDDA